MSLLRYKMSYSGIMDNAILEHDILTFYYNFNEIS